MLRGKGSVYRLELLVGVLLVINVLGFALMGFDKGRAVNGGYRVPERQLLLTALLGGAAGVWLGMCLFRHKTRHLLFSLGVPLLLILQSAAAMVLFS